MKRNTGQRGNGQTKITGEKGGRAQSDGGKPELRPKDLPHLGMNTLAFLLPPLGAGAYLVLRGSMPRRGASAARWAWAGTGFYAGCYLVLWICFHQ